MTSGPMPPGSLSPRHRIPDPGSDQAIDEGCTCPVMDNNHGQRPPWPPNGWYITEGCPLHAEWAVRE